MANELSHGSVGTELTQAEWEGVGTHVLNSQASGDIIYAASSTQLSRLAKATDGNLLQLASGFPAWTSSPTIGSTSWANANHAHAASNSGGTVAGSALSGTSLASGIVSTSITSVGTIATGVWQGTAIAASYVATLNQSTTGNAATATALATGRTINGVSFDGTGNITVPAAAGTLTGSTLASGVTASSLTSLGTLTTLGVGNAPVSGYTAVAYNDSGNTQVRMGGDGADKYALFAYRNLGSGATSLPVVYFNQDEAGDDQATLRVNQGGSGDIVQFYDGGAEVWSIANGGDVDMNNNDLTNVGGSNNDWTSSALTLGNGTQLQTKEGAWLKQAAESTSPWIYEVIGTTGAVSDNTSTAIVDITIANQHQVGVLYLHYLTNSTAVDRVESGCIVMTFGRYQGSNTAWKIDADEASMPYSQGDNLTGSETITVTASAAIASGGTGATQVLQVSITSDNSNGVNAITHWKANLMSSYAPAPNDSIYMTMAKA